MDSSILKNWKEEIQMSKELIKKTVWLIMTKDRLYIAKGVPRDRWIIPVNDKDDSKRVLTYSSKKKAESAFKHHGFYCGHDKDLEVVECLLTIKEKSSP